MTTSHISLPSQPLELLRRALPNLPPRLREVGRFLSGNEFDAATRSMRRQRGAPGLLTPEAKLGPLEEFALTEAFGSLRQRLGL